MMRALRFGYAVSNLRSGLCSRSRLRRHLNLGYVHLAGLYPRVANPHVLLTGTLVAW